MYLWIILGIIMGLLVVALFVMMLRLKRKEKRKTDYYNFFIIGIVWLASGAAIFISTRNPGLLAMGVIFTAMGLANRSKWKENRMHFSDLTPEEKKIKKMMIVVLTIMILLGIVAYMAVK